MRAKLGVCKRVGLPDTDENAVENQNEVNPLRNNYWRLWLFDAVLVSAGIHFFLAAQYGTYEFFGKASAMALLPLIPVMVLVGGAGSTIFALTKVWIEKRAVTRPLALALLVGPALVVALVLGLLGAFKSPGSRLGYICLGNVPAAISRTQIAGYSTFLREEWLVVFKVDPPNFQKFVDGAKLEPVPSLEFSRLLERSSMKATKPFQNLPTAGSLICFKRVFNEPEEHQRGSVYTAYDPASTTAVVFREYHD